MPVEQRIDVRRQRVLVTVTGRVDLAESIATVSAAIEHPDLRPGFEVYSDHRGVTEPLTPAQLPALIDHLRSVGDRMKGARWAIVATQPASYGMMRMLSVHGDRVPMEIQVFKTAAEAEAWLASPRRSEGQG